jgi:hypothetical protein
VAFSKNGVALGEAFLRAPAPGSPPLFPAVCIKDAKVNANFGGEGQEWRRRGLGWRGGAEGDRTGAGRGWERLSTPFHDLA